MPTVIDVAKRAGVSTTTVSYAITGKRFVSDELKHKVLQAMKEVGYRPNNLARSLRLGKTDTIGLVIPDSSNLFFAEISKYVEDIGFTNSYTVFLCNSDDKLEKQREYLDVLIAKQVDGIVFISVSNDKTTFEMLSDANIPYVIVDRDEGDPQSDIVLIDNFKGGYIATEYLISMGHTRIGCITGPSPVNPSADRHKGYLQALKDNRIEIKTEYVTVGDFRFTSGYVAMIKLLELTHPPTAVFIQNDMMALGAYRAINEKSLNVPNNISIIGFDNSPIAEIMTPALTTIAQPIFQIAEISMKMLLNRIKGEKNETLNRIVLDPQLIIRDSCSQFPKKG